MSVRRAVARPGEVDDLMDEVRLFERSSLPEHQKAALRFTDAWLANPCGFGDERRAELRERFSPEQIVELTLKLMYWSVNKALIALGIDDPVDTERLTEFHYDDHGVFVLHR